MRTTTAPELTTLAAATRVTTLRVKVENGSGTMIDLSSWVEAVSIDRDIDQPIDGCTITFRRDSGTLQSLAPLREDSTLNVDDLAAYSPLLDLNRIATVEVATTDIGAAIVAGDYKLLFKGTSDVVNFEQSPIVVVYRDLGAPLVDRWVEAETTYGSGVGIAIQTVMQSIIDDVFGAAVHTVYVPVSPGFNVVTYRQQKMSVMDALQDLVQLIGWDIRYKWDDGTSAFRLTLSEPPRTKTVPDYTFGPSAYINIRDLELDLTNIRNVVSVSFKDSADLGNRNTVTVSDAPSITKYGRRFFLMQEADSSPIDTSAEATEMADAALADLKDPKANQEAGLHLFWPTDLGDLYRYSPNAVTYNVNQDLAVSEITHEISRDSHRTRIRVRGSPAGQYITWLGRGGTGPGGGGGTPAVPPHPFIQPLNTEADDLDWDLRFNAVNGSGGGGTNLTYTVKLKKTFASESTLSSGNASAFPLDLTVDRDPKQAAVLTFKVIDAATGLFAEVTYPIPAYTPAITATGDVSGSFLVATSVPTGALEDEAVTTAKIADGNVTKAKTEARLRARVYKSSSAQVIGTSAMTPITFDAESFDIGTLHDNVTNNSRITIPTGGDVGAWFLTGQVSFVFNATGDRTVALFKNGAQVASIITRASAGTSTVLPVHFIDDVPTVGDYYEVQVFQDSGGNLNVSAGSQNTWFSAVHLW